MKLVLITAFVAVCGAAKLDRTYLPPPSAKTAGGSAGSLQTPFAGNLLHQANGGFPKGSFTNEFQGVVVDAAAAGTRATDGETGLGAPRLSYGSTNSKVGDAAFRGTAGFRLPNTQAADVGSLDSDVQAANTRVSGVPQGFSNAQAFEAKPERAQAAYDRAANTLRFDQEVGTDSYHFGFETDNGISQEENGVAANGVQAQGGYSYTGDDGQVYSVTYTADEGGYQPKGDHLPTPPPIPEEILKSLEQNARDEAAGLVDDGTYDAQKYNAGADYSESDIAGVEQNVNQSPSFGRRPVSDATASSSFINQNNQAFVRPNSNEQPGQKDESSNTQISSSNNFGPSKPNNGFAPVKQPNGLQSNEFGSRNEYKPAVQGLKQHEKTQRPENDIQQSNAVSESGSQFSTPQESQSSLPFGTSNRNIINTQSFSGSTNPSRANDIGPKANSQSSTTTFGVNAGNRFASRNEYLPPMQGQSIGPQRPSIPSISTPQQALNQISESGNFQAAGQSSVGFAPNLMESNNHVQAPQVFNTFQQKPQGFQQSRPQGSSNQFSQNSFVAQKEKTPKDKETATSPLESQRPTSVPSIELTTPLESSQPNVPTNLPSDRIPSSTNTIDTQHINGRPSTQFGTQPTSNKQQARPISKIQSQVSSNGFPAHGQNQYPSSPSSPDKQRLQQNEVHQNQLTDSQYSPSTIRPSFNQQAQSVDDSYYYKQPAKPFNTPKFPNSPSGQFNGVAQFSGNFQQNFPTNSFQPQRGQPNRGSTRYPEPPTLATAVPTTSFNEQFQGITTSSQSNGITQASISPFRPQTVQASSKYPKPPTVTPTAPTTSLGGFSTPNNGIIQTSSSAVSGAPTGSINLNSPTFGLKPSFQSQNNQFQTSNPNQSFGQRRPLDNSNKNQQDNSQASPTPQYSGEIYEYTKPSERLPAPSKPESTSSPQQGQTQPQFEPQGNRDTQELNAQKPSRPTLGSRPQFGSQRPQFTQSTSLTAETQTQSAENSKPQFNTPIKPYGSQSNFGQAQNSHNTQELNTQQPSSPTFGARPQFGSQIPQFAQSTLVNAEAQVQTAEPSKPQFNLPSRPYGSQPEYSQVQDNRNMQKMNTQQPTRPTFGARPQFGSQRPQFGQSASANAEAQVQTAEGSKTQFNVPSRPYGSQPQFGQAQDNRNTQELNTQQPSRPTFGARPQFGSQLPQFAQSTPVSAEAQVQTSEVFKSQFNVPSRAYEQEQSQRPQAPEKSKSGQNNGRPNNCCQSFNTQTSNQESQRPQNSNQGPIRPQFAQPGSQFSGFTSQGSSQFAGKGEEFGGPRKPPSFDQETGYHY